MDETSCPLSIPVSEARDEGFPGALESFGEGVVPRGLQVGGNEELARAGGFTGGEDLGGVARVEKLPLEGDGIRKLFGKQCVEPRATDGLVVDLGDIP